MARVASVTVMLAAPLGARGQAPPPGRYMAGPCDDCGGMVGPEICDEGYGGGCGDACSGYYGDPYGHGEPHHGFTGPMPMGYGGTNPPIGYDLMNDVGVEGWLVDQRGPHYWDFRGEAVYLTRDETFGENNVVFTTEDVGGPIRLFSDQLDYDYQTGFRIMGRYDLCPLAVLEFGYTGIFDFDDSQTYIDQNDPDLFSLFSNFGDEAVFPGVTNPGGPGAFTERARQHRISIESDLQTAEISYRRYWLGWIPRVSGTLLAGFRYTKLNEEFQFSTIGSENVPFGDPTAPVAALDYTVDADNDLSGFQLGADIWVGLMQGLRIGAEGKAGLYANRFELTSEAVTTPLSVPPGVADPSLFERFRDTQPAFIAEASADVVADILPSISLRAGYEVLFFNSIVLAGDNFNTGSPYNQGPVDNGLGPLRTPFLNDQSDAFYHGGHAGIEYIW